MIEYILMMSIIAGVILSVFAGVIKPWMERIQEDLGQKTTTIMAQDRLGIPLEWFFGDPKSFDDLDARFDAASQGAADGARNGGSGGPGMGRKGSGGDDGPGSRGRGRGGNDTKLGNTADSRRGGSDSSSSSAGTESGFKDKGRRTGKGPSGEGAAPEEAAKAKDQKEEKPADEKGDGKDGDNTPEGLALRAKKEQSRAEENRRGGGCREMNLFTLLKIGALIAIGLLGAAVLVTAKGQKGD